MSLSFSSEYFSCPVCYDTAWDARASRCCHAVFCKTCADTLTGQPCPYCRLPFIHEPNIPLKRYLDEIKQKCEKCGEAVRPDDAERHRTQECKEAEFQCPVRGCAFQEKLKGWHMMFSHLETSHAKEVLRILHCTDAYKADTPPPPSPSKPSYGVPKQLSSSCVTKSCEESVTYDAPSLPCLASARRRTRSPARQLGTTGKYYCGNRIPFKCCTNCDGRCGPTNGCNCVGCMRADVKSLSLPGGFLVNRAGYIARWGLQGYVCLKQISDDTWCRERSKCFDCYVLDMHADEYREAWTSEF